MKAYEKALFNVVKINRAVWAGRAPENTSMLPSSGRGNARSSRIRLSPNSSPSAIFTMPRKIGAAPLLAPNLT